MRGTHASPGSAFARAEQGFPHQSSGRPLHASLSTGLEDILIVIVATRQDQGRCRPEWNTRHGRVEARASSRVEEARQKCKAILSDAASQDV